MTKEFAFEEFARNGSAIDSNQRSVFAPAAAVNLVGHQFLARSGFAEDEHRSFGGRDQINLADDVPERGALADKVTEGLRLDDGFLQIRVLKFELRFEPLDFLEGARVGNGGTHVVTEELAPRTSFLANFGAQIPNQNSEDLFLKTDRRATESQNTFSPDPNRIGQPFPVPIRLLQDDSAPGRCDLAQDPRPHGYCVRRFAQSGRKVAGRSSKTQTTLCFVNEPDLGGRDLGGLLDGPRDEFVQ